MFDLVVFDWDGTLMDSEHTIVECLQQAARDLGYPVPSQEQARDVIGLGLNQALAKLFSESDGQKVQALADAYRRCFLREERPPSPLFPGARQLLQSLQEQHLMLAVATGKSRRGLEMELDHTGLREYFFMTRCADEAISKPHPQMLLDILQGLGVEGKRTLVVGDTEYDMQMAVNGGCYALGVSHGVHSSKRLKQHGAVAVLDSLPETADWVLKRLAG